MSKQTDLFNPIQENGKSLYWNNFYKGYFKKLEREKKAKAKSITGDNISIKQFIK